MTLTPEQIAQGWRLHDGSYDSPIKDDATLHDVRFKDGMVAEGRKRAQQWRWNNAVAYRIIEAHGADAEPARPTPYPNGYDDLVFTDDGWSQTIIVDGKRPEWLRDEDECTMTASAVCGWKPKDSFISQVAIRVRRREPKRETVGCWIMPRDSAHLFGKQRATIDLIDGKPDDTTLKIAEDAL